MAFPGTFNINYYKGDTYEFNVYPKTTAGSDFDMTGYETAKFTISSVRGVDSYVSTNISATLSLADSLTKRTITATGDISSAKVGMLLVKTSGVGEFGVGSRIIAITGQTITVSVDHVTAGAIGFAIDERYEAYGTFSQDKKYVKCAIQPSVAAFLDATKSYVYDVQIRKTESPYDKVFTLLTGTIAITEEVTIELSVPETIVVVIPNTPESLAFTEPTGGRVSADWNAPTSGDAPTSYKVYGKATSLGVLDYVLLNTITAPTTVLVADSILGYPIVPATAYDVKVTSVNSAGENTSSFATASLTTSEFSFAVTGLALSESAPLELTVDWVAPATGYPPTSYKLYGKAPALGVADYALVTTVTAPTTTYTASTVFGFGLAPGVEYFIKVVPMNGLVESGALGVESSITLDGVTDGES